MNEVNLPENYDEVLRITSAKGLDLEELEDILELEIRTKRRQYVVMRLISRINRLRAVAFNKSVMRQLSEK